MSGHRKHARQITGPERAHAEALLKNHGRITIFSDHCRDRLKQKFATGRTTEGIVPEDFYAVLRHGKLIEIREPSLVVMRGAWDDKRDICICLNLVSGVIRSVWPASLDDHHATLDLSVYTLKIDAANFVERFLPL